VQTHFRFVAALFMLGVAASFAPAQAQRIKAPDLSYAAGDFSLAMRGQVTLDSGTIALGDNPAGAVNRGGMTLRRFQVAVGGDLAPHLSYNLGFIFAGKGETVDHRPTLYLDYDGAPVALRVGIFAASTGMEDAVGSGNSLFLERASGATVGRSIAGSPTRATAMLYRQGSNYLASVSFTGGRIGGGGSFDEQQSMVGRFSWLAINEGGLRWSLDAHVGHVFDYKETTLGSGIGEIRLGDGPENGLEPGRTIDTGRLDARAATNWGFETGATYGAAYLQGGFFQYHVDRALLPDPDFDGWYVQASWSLTGDARRYNAATATFRTPVPARTVDDGGPGAIELMARYSTLDLNFNPLLGKALGGVTGGAQGVFAAGVNWFPNNTWRLSLIYQNIAVDHPEAPANHLTADALTLRTQIVF
jgi:phosphate-selective porin OprO/OprP